MEKSIFTYTWKIRTYRNFVHTSVLTQDTFLALGVFSMATCKAETTNNSPTSMESQMEGYSRCLGYPRVWSSLAWLTQAHWACGQVTIKKVIFLPDVQSNQTETYLSSAAAGCISAYPWNPKSALPFEKLKPKVKGTYCLRHLTCPVRTCRVQLSSKLPAKHWSCRRMKPSTGSPSPSEDVKDTHTVAACTV